MKVSYVEGVAYHNDPESCTGGRKTSGEALTGAHTGQPLSLENCNPECRSVSNRGKATSTGALCESPKDSAGSKTLCMCENSIRENREILELPEGYKPSGRPEKGKTQKSGMFDSRKSDNPIVPTNHPNKGSKEPAEGGKGRGLAKGNVDKSGMPWTQGQISASPGLVRVRQAALRQPRMRFNNLFPHINLQLLNESYLRLNTNAALGVDQVTWKEYGLNLQNNLTLLLARIHHGTYRPKPSKRTYILKASGKLRPIGIASLEDKIVQAAMVALMNGIYESDFKGFSYGFRPGKSQHEALDALIVGLTHRGINYVLDADISGFFDNIDHGWLEKFIQHRISDSRILRLIRVWMKSGISENGTWRENETGTPQGSVISPLLANIYLHYVLDQWANFWRKTRATGEMIIVRYADDFVIGFSNQKDAVSFQKLLKERLQKFKLNLHPDKTRLIEFGEKPFKASFRGRKRKPKTFNFLGFTFFCTKGRTGYFQIGRITIRQRMTARLKEIGLSLKKNRHKPIKEQGTWLRSVVNGYFNYHAIPGNQKALWNFRKAIGRLWKTALRRRGQKRKPNWDKMKKLMNLYTPKIVVKHPNPFDRFYAKHPR